MKEDIKTYVFETLPTGSGKWIVVAWGKIVNDRTGSYQQEIVLKRYSEKDRPSKTWDLKDFSKLVYCKVDLGSLRVLSPGTIIRNQMIVRFVHEYLKKREIRIEDPQALLKKPFRVLYDPTFPDWERLHLITPVDKSETRLLEGSQLKVLIPCNVIADYYYYGMTYLIKAILEGKLSTKFKNGNDVYNPKTLSWATSPTGKLVVRVELQRRMSFKDEFKIARLAHDDYFRSKCLDIYANILRGSTYESYVDTDLPINEPTTLSVYGVEISNKREKFFLVHSISKCNAKPPFDLILAGKDFMGESFFEASENGSGEKDDPDKNPKTNSLNISPKPKPKKRRKVKLSKGGKKNIGGGRALWNSEKEEIPYDKDQENNFPEDAAINEKDFGDPEKREGLLEIIRKFGIADGLTTNPNKTGSSNNLQIGLIASGPAKSKPAPPTDAFENIEKLTLLLEESLSGRGYQLTSQVRCPVMVGIDKYSAFPVTDLMMIAEGQKKVQYLNFCFLNVRQEYHTHHRRIYINELVVKGHVFYIMDVEPKYKVVNENKVVEKFIASFGVIFFTGKSVLSDDRLKEILILIVTTYQGPSGRWKFLAQKFGYQYARIQHRGDQRSFDLASKFIIQLCERT
jgi:hypothetical protein